MTVSLADFFIELAAIEQARHLTPGQRLVRRVEAAIAREPDAGHISDELRRVLEQAS